MRGEKKEYWRGGKKRRVGGLAAAGRDGRGIPQQPVLVQKHMEINTFSLQERALGGT